MLVIPENPLGYQENQLLGDVDAGIDTMSMPVSLHVLWLKSSSCIAPQMPCVAFELHNCMCSKRVRAGTLAYFLAAHFNSYLTSQAWLPADSKEQVHSHAYAARTCFKARVLCIFNLLLLKVVYPL